MFCFSSQSFAQFGLRCCLLSETLFLCLSSVTWAIRSEGENWVGADLGCEIAVWLQAGSLTSLSQSALNLVRLAWYLLVLGKMVALIDIWEIDEHLRGR